MWCPIGGPLDCFRFSCGGVLKRPDSAQLTVIRRILSEFKPYDLTAPYEPDRRSALWGDDEWSQPYRGTGPFWAIVETPKGGGVPFEQVGSRLSRSAVLLPTKTPLRLSLTVYGEHAYSYSRPGFGFNKPWEFESLPIELLAEWDKQDQRLSDAESASPTIYQIVSMFERVLTQIDQSPFRIVFLFSVLEGLLVHDAKGREDGIARQLQRKIPFIWNRGAERPASGFGNASDHEIWGALYALRSICVHGGTPKFGNSTLQKIDSFSQADDYLVATCRSLLRFGLLDPSLVTDLARC